MSSQSNEQGGGAQRPRICNVPPYPQSSGDDAIALAAMAGLYLDDWQQYVLRGALGETDEGRWTAQTVGLVVGRQSGKGSILEARELFGLFVLGERVIIHTAHLQSTASAHFRRLRELIQGVPEFEARVKKFVFGKGNEAIELTTGEQILFTTRMGKTGRGLTIDMIVYDEAMYLTETERSALAPTMAARSMEGTIQTWYTGSAVDKENPTHDGVPFAQIRKQGMNGADKVAYFEWSAPGDDPDRVTPEERHDMHLIAMANPGLGIRISEEWVAHERDVELGARGFAVERMGIGDWPDPDDLNKRAIPIDAWNACFNLSAVMNDPVCFALDVTPDRSSGAIAAAGLSPDGKIHIGVIEHKRGTEWILEKLEALMHLGKPIGLVIDAKSQGCSFIPDLIRSKIEPETTNSHEYAQACGIFYDSVVHKALSHHGTPELDEAVLNAMKRPLGDAWAWDKKTSATDISPLVACTLALWGNQTLPEPKKKGRIIDLNEALREAQRKEQENSQ